MQRKTHSFQRGDTVFHQVAYLDEKGIIKISQKRVLGEESTWISLYYYKKKLFCVVFWIDEAQKAMTTQEEIIEIPKTIFKAWYVFQKGELVDLESLGHYPAEHMAIEDEESHFTSVSEELYGFFERNR